MLSNLENSTEQLKWNDKESSEMGLLLVIISIIYLSEKEITQDALYEQLKRLGFRQDNKHPIFQDWAKLIEQKFTKQKSSLRSLFNLNFFFSKLDI